MAEFEEFPRMVYKEVDEEFQPEPIQEKPVKPPVEIKKVVKSCIAKSQEELEKLEGEGYSKDHPYQLKSSGIDGDAGDWTASTGEGLDYPGEPVITDEHNFPAEEGEAA